MHACAANVEASGVALQKPCGVLTSLLCFGDDGSFGLAMIKSSSGVGVGGKVRVQGANEEGGSVGTVVHLAFATRAGEQAGGGRGEPMSEKELADAEATEAKKAAEAERKAARLAAMAAKMKELGLA